MMDRRKFIKCAMATVVCVATPDIIVQTEIPKSAGNVWMKPEEVAAEALAHLEGHLADSLRYIAQMHTNRMTKQLYEEENSNVD